MIKKLGANILLANVVIHSVCQHDNKDDIDDIGWALSFKVTRKTHLKFFLLFISIIINSSFLKNFNMLICFMLTNIVFSSWLHDEITKKTSFIFIEKTFFLLSCDENIFLKTCLTFFWTKEKTNFI